MGRTNNDRVVAMHRLRELLGTMLGGEPDQNVARVLGLCSALDDADRLGTEVARRMGAEAYYAEGYDVGVSLAEALEVSDA